MAGGKHGASCDFDTLNLRGMGDGVQIAAGELEVFSFRELGGVGEFMGPLGRGFYFVFVFVFQT